MYAIAHRHEAVMLYGDTRGGVGLWYHQTRNSRPVMLETNVGGPVQCMAACTASLVRTAVCNPVCNTVCTVVCSVFPSVHRRSSHVVRVPVSPATPDITLPLLQVVIGTEQGMLSLVDWAADTVLSRVAAHPTAPHSIAWTPLDSHGSAGRLLTTAADGSVAVWAVEKGELSLTHRASIPGRADGNHQRTWLAADWMGGRGDVLWACCPSKTGAHMCMSDVGVH